MTDFMLIIFNLIQSIQKKNLPKEMSVLLIAYYRKALEKWIPSHFLFTCIDSDSVTLGVKLIEKLR